ncbi:MAG: phosphoenolpyruvate--protein phosphotransferase [Acidobacteria bacterium]|nr:phosphoenolpyruvate--protein phosphotransferase [Acidobacteriota bacterium]
MASKPEKIFRGSGVSPGVVLGRALKLDSHSRFVLRMHIENVDDEIHRYLRAIEAAKEQLKALKSRLEQKLGSEHGIILDAHLLILEDKSLNAEIIDSIRKHNANADWAVMQATDRLVHAYQSLEDEYFRERHSDIEHVAERILLNLSGKRPFNWGHLPENQILVSRDFNPSNFATMDLHKIRGLVMETGGRTSHTAIISRGLGLPAVMGIGDFLSELVTGDTLLLNGDDGQVIVNPTQERIGSMSRRLEAFGAKADLSPVLPSSITRTKDGKAISLRANTEMLRELDAAKRGGAEGIGLFRSEFLFFGHPHRIPGMEEQLAAYRMLAREMSPHPVSIRTLDAGSERLSEIPDLIKPENPSMGLRGIRLSLRSNEEAFNAQIEAILRASSDGRIEIVLPMISTIEEIWEARSLIEKTRSRLAGIPGLSVHAVPIGAMIEVPAVVLSLEKLAKEVDFLCVGTNDLIQYLLAVDRSNAHVAYLFQPLHPSVLTCLNQIRNIARKTRKPVRICGEISSNPFYAVLLVGMGFRQLSMNPLSIPMIRKVLHEIPMSAAQQIAKKALTFVTAAEVYKYLTAEVAKLISWDLSSYAKEIAPPNGPSHA